VNLQESRENGLAYVQRMGMSWATLADDDGRVVLAYGVFGPPETFFIGRDGIIEGRHIGPIDEATLVKAIEELRGQASSR
jgi:cytochrome c biogenesis protein CcmG/thiol:disulfide interchange protein DsbE